MPSPPHPRVRNRHSLPRAVSNGAHPFGLRSKGVVDHDRMRLPGVSPRSSNSRVADDPVAIRRPTASFRSSCKGAVYAEISKEESRAMMRTELLRFNGAVERDPAIDAWMKEHAGELGAIAVQWFEVMRKCGDEVRELLHDGYPVACLGDAPFGYVNVFTSHINVGFFHGAALPDPARLLQGNGKFMRHVKLRPGTATNAAALSRLIDTAYSDIKERVEDGYSSEKRLERATRM